MLLGRNKRPRIITGLDIGTTKVCAIIGQADLEGKLSILGMGSHPSKGLQRGEIIDIQPTIDAIVRAVNQAVEQAHVPISDIYVGMAGPHIRTQNTRAMVEIRHRRRGIDEKDCRRATDKAMAVALPEDLAIIQSVIQEFSVNGRRCVRHPIGLSGQNLEVHMHLVMACVDALNNILKCVRHAGLPEPHLVLQSLASSMSVITPAEQELGAVLIDMGGGTTDIGISIEGAIRETLEIPLAGDRITRDIAEILSCSLHHAENCKKRFGCALPEMVERERTFELPTVGDLNRVAAHKEYHLARIIEARLEEIFQLVRHAIEHAGYKSRLPAGAILTGGTALLPGITDVAERILEMKCRYGAPKDLKGLGQVVSSPIYSTGVGLILSGVETDTQAHREPRSRVRRILDYLVALFLM